MDRYRILCAHVAAHSDTAQQEVVDITWMVDAPSVPSSIEHFVQLFEASTGGTPFVNINVLVVLAGILCEVVALPVDAAHTNKQMACAHK